jgi:hypothetical protein
MSCGKRILAYVAVLVVLAYMAVPVVFLAAAGCSGGGDGKDKVDKAISMISSSRPLLEDLLELVERFDTLGTRYSQVEETIAEGKSLAEMALIDVDELESRYTKAGGRQRPGRESDGGD